MEKQDLNKLETRKIKGLKRKKADDKDQSETKKQKNVEPAAPATTPATTDVSSV